MMLEETLRYSPFIMVLLFALGTYIWLIRDIRQNKKHVPHHPAAKVRP